MYYLQSRYYNSEWGRFLNADNYAGTIGEILSHNVYAYCKNNPVNMIDSDGNSGILITAICAVVIVVAIGTIPQDTWRSLGEAIGTIIVGIVDTVSSGIQNITTKRQTKSQTVTRTISKTTNKNKNRGESNYWEAKLQDGNVVIGKPISYTEASLRVKTNKNIMCKDNEAALKIARQYPIYQLDINKYQIPGRNYYLHYHINGKHGAPHIWFYAD